MISTKSSHSATLVDNEQTNKSNERITKPQVVLQIYLISYQHTIHIFDDPKNGITKWHLK